jgi:Ca2+-binding RTX toxin-like protein
MKMKKLAKYIKNKTQIVRLALKVYKRYILLLALIAINSIFLYKIVQDNKTKNAYAFGDFIVNCGTKNCNQPLFDFDDFKPGDCSENKIKILNGGSEILLAKIKTANTTDTGLASGLNIKIFNDEGNYYGEGSPNGKKYLTDFYTDSNPNGIPLSEINPGSFKYYQIKICFDIDKGNEYQLTSTKFDLIFAQIAEGETPIDVPEQCSALAGIITKAIYGTTGSDDITGSNKSELIVAYGGHDRVYGKGGDDCIIAGDGNDRIYAGKGNDIVITGTGNDMLYTEEGDDLVIAESGNKQIFTGSGDDRVFSTDGNDKIETGSGNDLVYAGGGNDNVNGGTGEDTLFGGVGNDNIHGNAGNDIIFGEDGNDLIFGDFGNDTLDGGNGTDTLFGGIGSDACTTGENLISCEI